VQLTYCESDWKLDIEYFHIPNFLFIIHCFLATKTQKPEDSQSSGLEYGKLARSKQTIRECFEKIALRQAQEPPFDKLSDHFMALSEFTIDLVIFFEAGC
jgi:hypothetical protein